MMFFLIVFGFIFFCDRSVAQEQDHGIVLTVLPIKLTPGVSPPKLRTIPKAPSDNLNGTLPGVAFEENVFFRSCDIDVKGKRVFLYDSQTNTLVVGANFDTFFNSSILQFNLTFFGISRDNTKLAYDWLSNNLYWTDPVYKRIGIKLAASDHTSNYMYKFIVDKDLSRPEGIAVDPIHRYLFWTDTGLKKIERSDLSGESREVIVGDSMLNPAALVTDISEERIYWIDTTRETIETVSYNGTDRRLIRRITDTHFYDIALFKDVLMVTDIKYNGIIWLVDKNTGQFPYQHLSISQEKSYGIAMYHKNVQPDGQDNCANSSCSDMCVNDDSAADGYRCLCRARFYLNDSAGSCQKDTSKLQEGVALSDGRSICIVDLRVLAQFVYIPECIYNHGNETEDAILFLEFDALRREIMFATAAELFILKLDQESPRAERIMATPGSISGISYDWINFNLYISDSIGGTIFSVSMETYEVYEVFTSLDSPASVLIVPLERKLFWISGTDNHTIESSSVTSKDIVELVDSSYLVDPKDLTHDSVNKRILWPDEEKIRSCSYDGTDLKVTLSTPYAAYTIHAYKVDDYLIWMSYQEGSSMMTSEHMVGNYAINRGFFRDLLNITALVDLVIALIPRALRYACLTETMSFVTVNLATKKRTRDAHVLQQGGTTFSTDTLSCLGIIDPVEDNFILLSDWTHNRIYQVDMATEKVHAVAADQSEVRTCVVYNLNLRKVLWSSFTSSVLFESRLDGSAERLLGHIDFAYIETFTIDYTSDNIYFTAVSDFAYLGHPFSFIGVISPEGLYATLIPNLHKPKGIAIYAAEGLLFYTERSKGYPYIGKASMAGSEHTVLIAKNIGIPNGLVIDYKARRLYWVDGYLDQIESADFNGGDRKTILEDSGADLIDIGLDERYIYIIGWNRPHVLKVSKMNGNSTAIIAVNAEFGRLESMFVFSRNYSSQPINEYCRTNDGKADCSTFCLPSANSYVCACQDGVNLLEDNKTCADVFRCNATILNGILNLTCSRYVGTDCSFECNYGFKPRVTPARLHCSDNGWDMTDPCEEIFCKSQTQRVVFPVPCDWKVGSECSYECKEGYKKTANVPVSISCGVDGNWTQPIDTFCQGIASSVEEQSSASEVVAPAVGGSIGAVVLICIILLLLCILWRRKKREGPRARRLESTRSESESNVSSHVDRSNLSRERSGTAYGVTNPVYDRQEISSSDNSYREELPQYTTIGSVRTVFSLSNQSEDSASVASSSLAPSHKDFQRRK